MSEEEKRAINNMKLFARVHEDMTVVTAEDMNIVLKLVEKQQEEIKRLKYSLKKASKIIDEYTNETEKDTKKIIEYQEKYYEKK